MQKDSNASAAELNSERIVRQAEVLEQLRPVDQIVEGARREIAALRAACDKAEAEGRADPERLRQARAASAGVEELIQHFDAMQAEVAGHSRTADQALDRMSDALEQLREQVQTAVERLETLNS
jgi:DNA repair ATPase RecN